LHPSIWKLHYRKHFVPFSCYGSWETRSDGLVDIYDIFSDFSLTVFEILTGELTFEDVLKDYFDSNQYIFPFFNYNPVIALVLLFTNKLTTYAWNFGDVFLMVMFRALYSRYNSLNRFLESLMTPDGSVSLIKKGIEIFWKILWY